MDDPTSPVVQSRGLVKAWGATSVLTSTLAFGLSMSVLCLFFATRRTIATLS